MRGNKCVSNRYSSSLMTATVSDTLFEAGGIGAASPRLEIYLIYFLKLLVVFLCLSLVPILWDSLWYYYQCRQYGCSSVKTLYNWPFGICKSITMVRAISNNTALDLMENLWRSHDERTMRLNQGGMMWIATIDPENIKTILSTEFSSYSLGFRREALFPFLGNGIFTLSGPEWRHSRAMLRPQFTREQVSRTNSLDKHMKSLIGILEKGNVVDAQELFHLLTLDTATEFLFGESADSLTSKSGRDFAEAFGYALKLSSIRLALGKLYWVAQTPRFWSSCKYIHKFVDKYVSMALQNTKDSERYIFIEELSRETRDPLAIRSESLNILLAGRDTTASTLSYAVWYLGNHKKHFASLRSAVIDLNPTYESLKACKPLQNVLNEVLRLHPIVPANLRTATKNTKLPNGNVFVPRGTNVTYLTYRLHRDPRIWGEDAAEFRPERWESFHPKAWEYIPFNGGPRICLGQQFALTEMGLALVRLCQNFQDIDIISPKSSNLLQAYRLTSSIAGGVFARFIPTHTTLDKH